MPQLVSAAILDQHMPTDQIRQTQTLLDAIVSRYRPTWSKLGACEEITDLPKRSVGLQGQTHQAGHHVVETDQFRGTVWPFQAKEDFGGMFIIMDAQVERALTGNSDLLCDVIPAVGEGEAGAHAATTNSSILKLSGCSLADPLCDGSRWGHQGFCTAYE